MSRKFEIQEIEGKGINPKKRYRITEIKTDGKIATCYDPTNAKLVLRALNYLDEAPDYKLGAVVESMKDASIIRVQRDGKEQKIAFERGERPPLKNGDRVWCPGHAWCPANEMYFNHGWGGNIIECRDCYENRQAHH